MTFTVEELTFLDMYKSTDIEFTKGEIKKALPVIDDGDMITLAKNVLSKLDSMSSEEFVNLDYTKILSAKDLEI